MAEKKQTLNITTPPCRLSFPNLFAPVAPGKLNAGFYTCSLYFPKKDKALLAPLSALIKKVVADTFGAKVPTNLQLPLKDGDKLSDENAAGCVVLRCKTLYMPQCFRKVNGAFTPVIDPEVFYPGCWVAASISPYAYQAGPKNGNNNGVGFGINSILFIRDDEPFVAREKAEEVFKDVVVDESAIITDKDPEAADIPGLKF